METLLEILHGCRRHDHRYQKIIYERYRGIALKTVFRYIYRYDEAIDVMNDGFVKVFTHFNRFQFNEVRDLEKIMIGWMKRIMVNTAIDKLRKKMLVPEIGGIPDYVWEAVDHSANADQLLIYKELVIQIKKLPPSYRIVFNMYVIDGFSHSEIADALHIPIGTSKSSLSRAKNLLQQYLQQMEKQAACSI